MTLESHNVRRFKSTLLVDFTPRGLLASNLGE
jgi:hypothetical protein